MLYPRYLISTSTVFISLLKLSNAEGISCEAAARQVGQPVDGWKLVKEYDTNTAGNRRSRARERCVREPTSLICEPQETLYYNPESRAAGCCQQDGSVTWQDEEAKLGWCCAVDHHWSGDVLTGEGGCCPTGFVMVEGQCVDKPPASSCGCHSKASAGEAAEKTEGDSQEKADETDELETVETDIGINYGSCYELSTSDGRPIGSNRENAVYTPNGLFQGLPFRVCRTTEDCAATGHEDRVTSKMPFYLQDQVGRYNDPKGTKGWVAYTSRGLLKMKFSTDEREAEELFASKGKSCGDEDCFKLGDISLELVLKETDCAPWSYEESESNQNTVQHDRSEL